MIMKPRYLAFAMIAAGVVVVRSVTARTLIIDDFENSEKVNSFGYSSTDDGTAVMFRRGNGRLTIVSNNPDAYFRSSLDEPTLCYDMSPYTHIRFRIQARAGQRISIALKEGNPACAGPDLYPYYAKRRMLMVHRYVSKREFNGARKGQLVEIPLADFGDVELKRIAEVFFNGIHTQGQTKKGARTRLRFIGPLEITDKPIRKRSKPPKKRSQAEFVTNCKPGTLAVTFDGPSKNVPYLIDLLEKYDGRATFFVRGQTIEEQPKLREYILDAYNRGHQIASHTYSHPSFTKFDGDPDFLRRELRKVSDILNDITGERPTMFRPPYGHINADTLHLLKQEGITHSAHWNLDSRDVFLEKKHPKQILKTIMAKLDMMEASNSGGLLLLHDFLDPSIDVVEPVLKAAKRQGFKFVRFDECIEGYKSKGRPRKGGRRSSASSLSFGSSLQILLVVTLAVFIL